MKHVIEKRQHGFTKGKLCLTNSVIFHDKVVTCLANVGLAAGIVYLDFSKALTVVFHSLPLDKLLHWVLGKCFLWWVGNWLTGSSRVGISSSFSMQQSVTNVPWDIRDNTLVTSKVIWKMGSSVPW